jgi:TolB protein
MKRTPSIRALALPLRLLLIAVLVTIAVRPEPAAARLEIDLTQPNPAPLPIAIPDFLPQSAEAQRYARDIAEVVSADLERSGLFAPIDKRAFLEPPARLSVQPRFANWRPLNAQALVIGETVVEANGNLRVDFRLWDVVAEQAMTGLSLSTTPANWRRVAHLIADAIYKRITGEEGYFDTRIVYISETGAQTRRVKRLAIMDQDGANHRFLTNGDTLVLTPRSPISPITTTSRASTCSTSTRASRKCSAIFPA